MEVTTNLAQRIEARVPWEMGMEYEVKSLGFEEPKKAWTLLIKLAAPLDFSRLFPGFFSAFLESLSRSYDPDLALRNFERFVEKIHDKNYLYTLLTESPSLMEGLVTLFSGSQVLTDVLLNNPSHFDWLKRPETLGESKSKDSLMRDFYEMAGSDQHSSSTPSFLRRFKKREYIRIGLRDLMGKADLRETVEDISNLADVCLEIAYEYADGECRKKYGIPYYQDADGNLKRSEFTILGMGKLGGRELNFSSDIDLIYLYTSSKGETRPEESGQPNAVSISNHEYFTRLAQLVTKTLNDITPEGNVFRVDLDLRPEGRSGEIVNSLAGCEMYYQSWGRTWERQALLKARICAGSIGLGKAFFNLLSPFIYRRSLDFSAIEEIKLMKEKINKSLENQKTGKAHIKLGFGGIREIEFIVQAYQLIFGGRNPALRVTNTLNLMEQLEKLGFLSTTDYQQLRDAYIFLRNLENRVQISFGLQTHVLPREEKQLSILARKMRIPGRTVEELSQGLMKEFEKHTGFVGKMFAGLFAEEGKQQEAEIISHHGRATLLGEELLEREQLAARGFPDPERIRKFLISMRDGPRFSHPTSKSIKEFYTILPDILSLCERLPKPGKAVENLVKFVETGGARETYLNLFESNRKFLELLLIVLGSSDFLAETLIKQPDLVDFLMDLESIYRYKPPKKIEQDLHRNLALCDTFEARQITLRKVKQGEELRIGIRYLIKETDLIGTLEDLSSLADVFLQTVVSLAGKELEEKFREAGLEMNFALFGLGKLGGHELNFGSDLDVIFVYDDECRGKNDRPQGEIGALYVFLAQLIYRLTSEVTPAGYAYKLDADLRPDGTGGALVHSYQGYEKYFNTRARVWEQQAMTRVRFVAGDKGLGEKFLNLAHRFTYRKKFEYGSLIEISRLRERMEKELAKEAQKGKNIKLGFGGLADIEFVLQILQMIHGYQNPALRETNTLKALSLMGTCGILDQREVEEVSRNYLFLRNLECSLRLMNQPFTNHLPKDDPALAPLAIMRGIQGESPEQRAGKLRKEYEEVTRSVRAFYRKTIDKLLRTSL